MQWSDDAHGGFCAPSVAPILPVIDHEEYGYRTTNVASQLLDSQSSLRRIQRLIRARRRHSAFSRGTIEFVASDNPRLLAFLRSDDSGMVAVVLNLSPAAQSAVLDVPMCVQPPVDLITGLPSPIAMVPPARVALEGLGYCWFDFRPSPAGMLS